MEEKFDQIEMDVSDMIQNITDDNDDSNELPSQQGEEQAEQQIPQINSADATDTENNDGDDDDDIELISPDEEIFKRAESRIKNADEFGQSDMYEWTNPIIRKKNRKNREEAYEQASIQGDSSANEADKVNDFIDGEYPSITEMETLQRDIHSDYYEYTDRQQRKEIIGMYKYAKRSIRTKIIISSIFALFMLLIENISLFTKNPTGIFNIVEHPYLHFFTDFILLALCALCAYEQLYHGLKSIISKEYIPEAIAVFSLGASIVYSIFTVIFIPFGEVPRLYNLPVAVICVLTIVFSYINVIREKYSFGIVSSRDTKFVLNKIDLEDAEAEAEAFSTISRDFVGELVRVDEAEFVKKYFARTNKSASTARLMAPYYVIAICIPVIFAIITIFKDTTFMNAMTGWFAGVSLIMPIGILFLYSVPFLAGNKYLYEEETSIIGEKTIGEFATTKAVSVNDTTAFPPYNVKMQGFNIYNKHTYEEILYYAMNGFSTVGGPLAAVFEMTANNAIPRSKRARFVCSGRSYLCVKVDNDTIIFADRYGITTQGIEDVPPDPERGEGDEELSVMYMACNGKLCARMFFNYVMDEDFAQTVRTLNKKGVSVGIRTFDPNLNNDLIKNQSFKKVDLRVIRLSKEDEIPTVLDKADSGIVTKGHSRSLIKAIPICKNIATIRKVGTAINIIASLGGAFLLFMGMFGFIPLLSPLLIVGYYVAWTAIMTVMSSVMLLQ